MSKYKFDNEEFEISEFTNLEEDIDDIEALKLAEKELQGIKCSYCRMPIKTEPVEYAIDGVIHYFHQGCDYVPR